jgi:hypothetical protein
VPRTVLTSLAGSSILALVIGRSPVARPRELSRLLNLVRADGSPAVTPRAKTAGRRTEASPAQSPPGLPADDGEHDERPG